MRLRTHLSILYIIIIIIILFARAARREREREHYIRGITRAHLHNVRMVDGRWRWWNNTTAVINTTAYLLLLLLLFGSSPNGRTPWPWCNNYPPPSQPDSVFIRLDSRVYNVFYIFFLSNFKRSHAIPETIRLLFGHFT